MRISLLLLTFISTFAFADSKLVLGDRVYTLQEQSKLTCGDGPGAPEYAAALFLMGVTQDLESNEESRLKIERIFKFIRPYPSRFTSKGCESLRNECESRCLKVKDISADTCKIECNQYESWNK
jgi:hypothetical protein